MRFDLFLKLQDLEGQQLELQIQADRDGLSAYRGRLEAAREESAQARGRQEFLEQNLPLWEAESTSAEQQERILQGMLELEDLPARLVRAEADLQEAEQDWEEAQPDELERKSLLQARLRQNEQERQACREQLGPEGVEVYARAKERYATPVVEVKSGRCASCRMELSLNEQRQLRLGLGQPCSTCQIVLVAARSGRA